MKIILDMNVSPVWVDYLQAEGFDTVHWSSIGSIYAPDHEIMAWAWSNTYVVFTHDLDFSAILAATNASGPSVFQVRAQDVLPDTMGSLVVRTLQQFENHLIEGAIITLDSAKSRARVLPIRPS